VYASCCATWSWLVDPGPIQQGGGSHLVILTPVLLSAHHRELTLNLFKLHRNLPL